MPCGLDTLECRPVTRILNCSWTRSTRRDASASSPIKGEEKGRVYTKHKCPSRQAALFIGRIRGRLSLKELGQLAGGFHHNAVGRNSLESTPTGKKNPSRQEIHWVPAGRQPPPVTTQCRWG